MAKNQGLNNIIKLLRLLFLFNIPIYYLALMVLAPIVKPITMVGFLIQYYLLIAFVFIKNLVHKILKHPRTLLDEFSYCPIKSVHPHVFAHTRTLSDQT